MIFFRFNEITLRAADKAMYNRMKEHPDIRFKLKKVAEPWEKVFVLIQASASGLCWGCILTRA
jgi:ATP-dependent DNA helicase HFM1/MER3